jgi:hypothetical protein
MFMQWLSSVFKPVKAMTLNSDECDMASYLFGHSTDELVIHLTFHLYYRFLEKYKH